MKSVDDLHKQIVEQLTGSMKFEPEKCEDHWKAAVDKAAKIIEKNQKAKPHLIESYYLYGSNGDYKLWGNATTIEASTVLEAGWGYDPADEEHNYDWQSWYSDGAGSYGTKEEFLEYWEAMKELCRAQ